MRFALITAVTLTLCGCSGERPPPLPMAPDPVVPTTPPPPARPAELTFVWVVVIEKAGIAA